MDSIILPVVDGYIECEITYKLESKWLYLYLHLNQEAVLLGYDNAEIIATRIIEHLTNPNPKTYIISNREFFWLITLFERHATLYITKDSPYEIVFCRDGDENFQFSLTNEHLTEWIEKLSNLESEL